MCAMIGSTTARGGDWPGWQGPNRDGKAMETGLLKAWPAEGPELLWKATNIGKGYSSVAVVKDTVYTSGDVGADLMLFALDAKGQIKWKTVQGPAFTASYGGSRSTPVVDGNRIYLVGGSGVVTCHGTEDGKPIWQRELKEFGGGPGGWGYSESVLILDDKVVVTPGGKTVMVALDKVTGKTVWQSDAEGKAHYSSAIVIKEKDSSLIVQGTGSGLIAVNAKDGRKVWSNGFCAGNTANCPDPAYADGYLFWANGYGKGGICFKVDVKDGAWTFTEAWQTKDMVCHHGGYVIDKGYIYGNHNGGWSCLDLKTGQPKWKDQSGVGKGSLCFADGMLYLFGEKGGQVGLAAASTNGLTMTGQMKVDGAGTSWAHPAVANGKLYIRYDSNLYCFSVKAK
jgi:outer membrane protein assembly factor BamB